MTKKIVLPFVIPLMLFQSCLGDLDPIPKSIDTYHYYYNNLLEAYPLQWEIDDVIIGNGHSYGVPAQAIVTLADTVQDVLIRARNAENKLLIDSLTHIMFEYSSYMIALMGTEEDPYLICKEMDTRMPSAGRIKIHFLHTSEAMGPVDIYIGGDQPERLALTNMDFTQASHYLEATEENLWSSLIVTPASSLPADSSILEYTANDIFIPDRIYLCILEHTGNSSESSFQIQVVDQPVY
jgi:hypothetical protein